LYGINTWRFLLPALFFDRWRCFNFNNKKGRKIIFFTDIFRCFPSPFLYLYHITHFLCQKVVFTNDFLEDSKSGVFLCVFCKSNWRSEQRNVKRRLWRATTRACQWHLVSMGEKLREMHLKLDPSSPMKTNCHLHARITCQSRCLTFLCKRQLWRDRKRMPMTVRFHERGWLYVHFAPLKTNYWHARFISPKPSLITNLYLHDLHKMAAISRHICVKFTVNINPFLHSNMDKIWCECNAQWNEWLYTQS